MKKFITIILILVMLLSFTACNYKFIDTKWDFDYAYITFPDGTIKEIKVKKWSEDSTSITLQALDGQVYVVNQINCMLTKDKWTGYSN